MEGSVRKHLGTIILQATSPIPAPVFDLKRTLESGQVFHWTPCSKPGAGEVARFVGLIGNVPVRVEQQENELRVPSGTEALATRYFALDHPLDEIYATFPLDPPMQAALAFCRGVRLIRQPVWECLATFITSSMKQVKHIQQMSHALRQRFGQSVEFGSEVLHAYPEAAVLARACEADLRCCGLGFRAKNLLGAARMVAGGEIDLEAIRALPDTVALQELCRLPGVGPKVANCVLLFAYERARAFPIDVWIERVLRERYFLKKRVTGKRLEEFVANYFGPHGGYAQQYLFHHARLTWGA